jgi:hypothetical protein
VNLNQLLSLSPPALLIRLLDDIHALAQFAQAFASRFDETIDVMKNMDRQTQQMMPFMEKVLPVMQEQNRTMAAALPVLERITPALLQTTSMFTSPIGGAIDRVGRVVDRLPGRSAQGRELVLATDVE